MGDWALMEGQRYEATGLDVSVTSLGAVTSSGTTHTKGSWVQLVASTAFDASGLFIYFANANTALFLIDIGIGAAAAEQVLIPDLMVQIGGAGVVSGGLFMPIHIPAATRISARCQADGASQAIRIGAWPMGVAFAHPAPLGRVTAYGTASGTTRGTEVDPGGSANTKGSYAQITSSTTNRIQALLLAVGFQKKATGLDARWLFDIAVGAAASEQIIIPDLYTGMSSTYDDMPQKFIGPFPIQIPSGTRIAMRAQCSETGATERTFDVAVYGID